MLPQHGLVCAQFTHLPLHLALFSSPILNILSESAKLPHTPKARSRAGSPPAVSWLASWRRGKGAKMAERNSTAACRQRRDACLPATTAQSFSRRLLLFHLPSFLSLLIARDLVSSNTSIPVTSSSLCLKNNK
ncbi:hypothetical protein V8C26DRAFT_398064 [Trichoderma gracile]